MQHSDSQASETLLRLPEVVLSLALDRVPRPPPPSPRPSSFCLCNLRHLMPLIPSPVIRRRDSLPRSWLGCEAHHLRLCCTFGAFDFSFFIFHFAHFLRSSLLGRARLALHGGGDLRRHKLGLKPFCFPLTRLFEETSRCLVTQHCHIRGGSQETDKEVGEALGQLAAWLGPSPGRPPPRGIQP